MAVPRQSRYPGSMSALEFAHRAVRWPRTDYVLARFRRVLVDGEAIAAVAASDDVDKATLYGSMKLWLRQSEPDYPREAWLGPSTE